MDPATAAIVGAAVGAGGVILASLVSALVQGYFDRQRWERQVDREAFEAKKASLFEFFEASGRLWESISQMVVLREIAESRIEHVSAMAKVRDALIGFDTARVRADLSPAMDAMTSRMSHAAQEVLRLIDLETIGQKVDDSQWEAATNALFESRNELQDYAARNTADGSP